LAVYASKTLRIAKVRNYINQHLKLSMMSADEVLKRLSKQGRADIADVLTSTGEFDFKKAKKRGNTDLIRKLKVKKTRRIDRDTSEEIEETTHELELHNAQTALELMGKHHGLFGDSGLPGGESAQINVGSVQILVVLRDALGIDDAIDVTPAE
jgi:multidrug efflux pump subunit AcrB